MNNFKCPNCSSVSLEKVAEYRFNVKFDRKYFGSPEIYSCNDCGLFFASPMPDEDVVFNYYQSIYRAKGRPHYMGVTIPKPQKRHFSYLSTISTFIDLQRLKRVCEIGPGWGEFGFLLKNNLNEITINCIELDSYVQNVLKQIGYGVLHQDNIKKNHDIVVSVHSFEHFANIDSFFRLIESALRPEGYVFLEVPNCPFLNGFEKRVYDSPHLLFFTKNSLRDCFERRGYSIISLTYEGYSFEKMYMLDKDWKEMFENWSPSYTPAMKDLIKNGIKYIFGNKLMDLLRAVRNISKGNDDFDASDFLHDQEDSWLIRLVAKKNANSI